MSPEDAPVNSNINRDGTWNLALDGIQEADEFLMAMALHVVADDRSVEDVHGREQSGRPVPLVVMGHSSGAAPLHRQAGLSTIEGLDLALFVDAEHHGVRRRIDIEPDHVAQLVDELGVFGSLDSLNCRTRCGWS